MEIETIQSLFQGYVSPMLNKAEELFLIRPLIWLGVCTDTS